MNSSGKNQTPEEHALKDLDVEVKPNDTTANNTADLTAKRQKNRRDSTSSEASVGIIDRILHPDYSLLRKVIWSAILLACSIICLLQLWDRLSYYLDEPTTFQVNVDRVHEIQFPAITICPAREPFHDEAWKIAFEIPNFFESVKFNVTVEDIWDEYAVRSEDVFVVASCNETNYCDFLNGVNTTLKSTTLPTFWGTCLTLYRDSPIEYRGASTFLEILLRPGTYSREWFGRNVAAQYFFHEPQAIYRHDAFLMSELWTQGRDTVIQITIKEFDFLNSTRNPCDSQAEAIDCRNKCIDEKLDKFLNCSLPFMTSKWPPCHSAAQTKVAFDRTRDFYYTFNSSECSCRRQCEENLFNVNTNTGEKRHDDQTAIVLQFTDNLVERVYEEYAYSFSALVSDVGGTIGIFLGLSILSFFKMFESAVDTCNKKKGE